MATFGKSSKDKLATAHPDLQKVMNEAIKHFDFQVLYGTRTVEEQFELYKQGRTLKGGVWVKTGATVTNLDGKIKKSNHNYSPSRAVDIVPFPIDWNDLKRFKEMADVVKKAAITVGVKNLVYGGDWKTFKDWPHFELKL